MNTTVDLHGLTPPDLAAHLRQNGVTVTDAETRRLMGWAISQGRLDFDQMPKPVPRRVRDALGTLTTAHRPRVLERVTDPIDHSVRYLFEAHDGKIFETVRIPLHKENHFSVCLSSQAGCAMKCDFCATGRLGLLRNLTAAEIVGAFCAVRDEAPGRVSGAVFMGQGEPFHNYDAVLQAAAVLSHPCGGRVAQKSITISTVGLIPRIEQFTKEGHKYRLIVSLTSAIDEKRARMMPVAGRWKVAQLAQALKARTQATGRRATLAWVLMGGVNHGQDEVEALKTTFAGIPLRLNLIDINDSRPDGYRRATDAERNAFMDALQILGMPIVRRYSVGQSEDSACGMLAGKASAALDDASGRALQAAPAL